MTDNLVDRLRRKREVDTWYDGGHRPVELVNPDGPEAADALEAQQARIAELEAERAKAWYDATVAENKRRFAACDNTPRIFVRHLRAPDKSEPFNPDDPLFEISEGRATELLAEREARAVERATAPLTARIRALEEALRPFAREAEKDPADWDESRMSQDAENSVGEYRRAKQVLEGKE